MSLPIDLVLVRHGQSEGNLAKRRSEKGDHTAYTPDFRNRTSSKLRLTDFGREQAKAAGSWLRNRFPHFDRYLVSQYLRAMETAVYLQLPNADWLSDFYLTERDWGDLDIRPENERWGKFGEAMRQREIEPFFWRPPNGESFTELCLRVDRVLETLHRECSDKQVIIVCHGEVIRAFQIRLERLPPYRFRELVLSDEDDDRIFNCQIIHYSRREKGVGRITKYAGWKRSVRPTENPIWDTGWQPIVRPRYTNEDLLRIVSETPAMIS